MSTRDQAVLDAIMAPLKPSADFHDPNPDPVYVKQEKINSEGQQKVSTTNSEKSTEDLQSMGVTNKELNILEYDAIRIAENGNLDESLNSFNTLVHRYPSKASLYNNRAQVFRLQRRQDEALEDISRALELCDNTGPVAMQALCQRALIHLISEQREKAVEDYRRAAKLGSAYAESQLIGLNPYAALCNSLLAGVIGKLRNPH